MPHDSYLHHVAADGGLELRDFGYPKVANAAALPALTANHVGTIYTTSDDGRSHQLVSSDGTTAIWNIWYADGTVTRENITGAASLDVAGHTAAELTITGDVTGLTLAGWDADPSKYQRIRVQIIQDATGERGFDWANVNGTWVETPPTVLDMTPTATSIQFYAITTDGGANVWLEPIGVQYSMDCVYMQVNEVDIPAVTAGGLATISHSYQMVASVELIEVATGRRVLADWWQSPGSAGAPVNIDFTPASPVGTYTARVAGLASTPCDLTVTTEEWETVQLAVTGATNANLTVQHTGASTDLQIVWGGGTAPIDVATGAASTHVYAPAYTGDVTIRWRRGVTPTFFTSTAGNWSFDISVLPSTLTTFTFTAANTITGDLSAVGASINTFRLFGSNTLSGDIGSLPAGISGFRAYGFNTISGNLATIPSTLTDFFVLGGNTVTGDISTLPATMLRYQTQGNNTTFGDVATLPAGLLEYANIGNNTTSGDIGSLPVGLTNYNNQGNNTVSGDIGTIPATIVFLRNEGLNTTTLTTTYTPNVGIGTFVHRPNAGFGLSPADVDSILAAIDGLATTGGAVTLDGVNSAPTAAGTVSAGNLAGRGWTVTTN